MTEDKSAAEALVREFKLERVLNQGTFHGRLPHASFPVVPPAMGMAQLHAAHDRQRAEGPEQQCLKYN